jgi:hypothetical protein
MTKAAAKVRFFLLLLATFTTVLALTPPKPAQACFSWDVEWCQQNGVWCQYSECARFNQCPGDPATLTNCGYVRTVCC